MLLLLCVGLLLLTPAHLSLKLVHLATARVVQGAPLAIQPQSTGSDGLTQGRLQPRIIVVLQHGPQLAQSAFQHLDGAAAQFRCRRPLASSTERSQTRQQPDGQQQRAQNDASRKEDE